MSEQTAMSQNNISQEAKKAARAAKYRQWYQQNKAAVCAQKRERYAADPSQREAKAKARAAKAAKAQANAEKAQAKAEKARAAKAEQARAETALTAPKTKTGNASPYHDRARREREFAQRQASRETRSEARSESELARQLERDATFAALRASVIPPNQDELSRLAARRKREDLQLARELGISVEELA